MQRFTIKNDCNIEDITMINPKLLVMLATILEFADGKNLPVVISSIINDRINVNSVSKTHQEGRALDISTIGWDIDDINELKLVMSKHDNIAALSFSTLKPSPVVYHDSGYGPHLHIQCRR